MKKPGGVWSGKKYSKPLGVKKPGGVWSGKKYSKPSGVKKPKASGEELIDGIKASMDSQRKSHLQAIIKRLSKLEDDAFLPRHGRYDFYKYLEAVLKVYWQWTDDRAAKTRGEQLGVLVALAPRSGRRALHTLIHATSKQPLVVKNRWVHALQFCAKNRKAVERADFASFIREHNGVAGCAALAVRNKRKVRKA
jgi:hypothetical protein